MRMMRSFFPWLPIQLCRFWYWWGGVFWWSRNNPIPEFPKPVMVWPNRD
jgi:hypothetical protein